MWCLRTTAIGYSSSMAGGHISRCPTNPLTSGVATRFGSATVMPPKCSNGITNGGSRTARPIRTTSGRNDRIAPAVYSWASWIGPRTHILACSDASSPARSYYPRRSSTGPNMPHPSSSTDASRLYSLQRPLPTKANQETKKLFTGYVITVIALR